MDLAGLEVRGWSGCAARSGGRTLRIGSLLLTVERRTRGSRVMVIRTGESGVVLDRRGEEGSWVGRLGETIQRTRRLYRDSRERSEPVVRSQLVLYAKISIMG